MPFMCNKIIGNLNYIPKFFIDINHNFIYNLIRKLINRGVI